VLSPGRESESATRVAIVTLILALIVAHLGSSSLSIGREPRSEATDGPADERGLAHGFLFWGGDVGAASPAKCGDVVHTAINDRWEATSPPIRSYLRSSSTGKRHRRRSGVVCDRAQPSRGAACGAVPCSATAAASELHVRWSAVSNSFSRLRDLFGNRLVIRSGNGLVPTPVTQETGVPGDEARKRFGADADGPGTGAPTGGGCRAPGARHRTGDASVGGDTRPPRARLRGGQSDARRDRPPRLGARSDRARGSWFHDEERQLAQVLATLGAQRSFSRPTIPRTVGSSRRC
jgi:hypothetical protein